ncbi:hypothetical protein V5G24_23090 [Xanthobacter sp. VTT E-85241]|uniref:hypothetical protein n=1 Tax=Roseixanthobacter finlandensis TaxID=3119922 RepID=UPI00372CB0A3
MRPEQAAQIYASYQRDELALKAMNEVHLLQKTSPDSPLIDILTRAKNGDREAINKVLQHVYVTRYNKAVQQLNSGKYDELMVHITRNGSAPSEYVAPPSPMRGAARGMKQAAKVALPILILRTLMSIFRIAR